MDERFQKYRNIISLNEDFKLTESQLKYLIKNNIYQESSSIEWGDEDLKQFIKENENFDISGTEILYNRKTYHLNEEIYNIISEEIFNLLKKRFKYWYTLQKSEIEFELGQFITKEEKQNYLNNKHSELWKSSELFKSINKQEEFLRFYKTAEEDLIKNEDWFESIWHETENHHILRYLSTNDNISQCFKEFIDKWFEFGRIKALSLHCKHLMSQIENYSVNECGSDQNSNTRLTPLEQVCYIDFLRSNDIKLGKLSAEEKMTFLKNITGNKNFNDTYQLESLENILALSDIDFDKVIENKSEYARRLNSISKISFTNLRKEISIFYKTPFLRENIKTPEDKIKYEKYLKDKVNIEKAYLKISNLD